MREAIARANHCFDERLQPVSAEHEPKLTLKGLKKVAKAMAEKPELRAVMPVVLYRTLGPALAIGDFSNFWVYLVGPGAGAIGGALFAKALYPKD